MNYVKELLDQIGLGGERLEIHFLSSAEGARFAEIATEMTERIRQLGPNPIKKLEIGISNIQSPVSKPGGNHDHRRTEASGRNQTDDR